MMKRRLAVAVAALSLSSACMSPLQKRSFSPIPAAPDVFHFPSLNSEAEAEIGTSMVSAAKRSVTPGIRVGERITHEGTYLMYPYALSIPAGALFQSGIDAGGTFYEAPQEIEYRAYTGRVIKVRGGVYVPKATPQATEVFWLAPNDETTPLNDAHPGIKFEAATVERWGIDSFKRELVYGGVSENTITVLYREFLNDMARPAFSQELKYDLSKGDVIGYRGARFQVLNVTNTGIKYKVLANLE